MRWSDVLPEHIAKRQASFERRHAMRRAREGGASIKELAAFYGIASSYISVMTRKADSEKRRGIPSPIEAYFTSGDRLNMGKRDIYALLKK